MLLKVAAVYTNWTNKQVKTSYAFAFIVHQEFYTERKLDVTENPPPLIFSDIFFQNGWEFLVQILRTYYTFLFTLACKFLSNYLQFWRSYATGKGVRNSWLLTFLRALNSLPVAACYFLIFIFNRQIDDYSFDY